MDFDKNIVKQIAVGFKTSLDMLEAKTDGYLLELTDGYHDEVQFRTQLNDPKLRPEDVTKTYNLLAISVMGSKNQCEAFYRISATDDLYLQQQIQSGAQTKTCKHRKHQYHQVKKRNKEEDKFESESAHVMTHLATFKYTHLSGSTIPGVNCTINVSNVKTTGPNASMTITLAAGFPNAIESALHLFSQHGTVEDLQKSHMGSLYRRYVYIHPKIKPENLSGDSTAGYLIGETLQQARDQFWNILDKLPAPIQPEWEEELWKRFTASGTDRVAGVNISKWRAALDVTDEEIATLVGTTPWIETLEGHRMFGYKINLDKEAVKLLISALVYSDALPNVIPAPEATIEEPETLAEAA